MAGPEKENREAVQPETKQQEKSVGTESLTKANIILDSLFNRHFYEEEMTLPGGRKCVFRTRQTSIALDIVSRLEEEKIETAGKYSQRFSLYCLAGSLRSMGGKSLPEEFEQRIEIIVDLPGPVTEMLVQMLVKFDAAVSKAATVEEVKN